MAITVQITDGTTTFDLVYDASTQPYYHSRKGLSLVSEDTDVLQHQPDDGEPSPIRGNDRDRTVFLTKDVLGTTQDEVLNKIAALKRFIDGKDQQALRYWTNNGDVDRVGLKIQLENATNYTLNPIKWGHVDDSGSHYTAAAQNTGYAIGILVTLHLTAYGEGAAITLRNDLPSSPHFIEDSNADGFADGVSTAFTAPTNKTLSTGANPWLIGGSCQYFKVDATNNSGIFLGSVTASSSTDAVAFVWVYAAASADPLRLILTDGSATTVEQKIFDPSSIADYDKTATDAGGRTWYRYSMSGQNAAANFRIYIYRAAASATFASEYYIDGAYLEINQTVVPDSWCSTSAIRNRYDPVTANPERINYVDVWGVPGDSDALVNTSVTCTAVTGSKDTVLASRWTDGKVNAADILHWVDSADMAWLILSGTQGTTNDASRAGGSYLRHTADPSSVDNANLNISVGSDFAELAKFMSVPHRVFLITRTSSTATTYQIDADWGFTSAGGVANSVNAANTWELLDLGYLNPLETAISDFSQVANGATITITVVPGATSATVDADAILLIPAVTDGWCVVSGTTIAADATYVTQFIGTLGVALGGRDGSLPGRAGSIWTIPPGNRMSRYVFAATNDSSNVHHLTDAFTVSLTVYPRTRHLLGTT